MKNRFIIIEILLIIFLSVCAIYFAVIYKNNSIILDQRKKDLINVQDKLSTIKAEHDYLNSEIENLEDETNITQLNLWKEKLRRLQEISE